jgi:hypothetical protein
VLPPAPETIELGRRTARTRTYGSGIRGPEIRVKQVIRRGTDVVKALALGARAVGIGRPILYGLALDGAAGVRGVLQVLKQELILALALCGRRRPLELDSEILVSHRR